MSDDLVKPVIETDTHDPSREYIPLPGGWEVQTRGRGSSYRLLDKKTGDRRLILCAEIADTQDFVTRMAKEVFAANEALSAENARFLNAMEYALDAINTNRSEPLFIARDLLRNTLADRIPESAARYALKDTEA